MSNYLTSRKVYFLLAIVSLLFSLAHASNTGPIHFINESDWAGKVRCTYKGWGGFWPGFTMECLDVRNEGLRIYIADDVPGEIKNVTILRSNHCDSSNDVEDTLVVTLRESGITSECRAEEE